MELTYVIMLFITYFFFSFLERMTRVSFTKWIFIIPFILLIANRSQTVPDTEPYIDYYFQENADLGQYINYGFEIGFQILTKITKFFFGDNYKLYFAFIALINVLVVNFSMKRIMTFFVNSNSRNSVDTSESHERTATNYTFLALTLYASFFGLYFNAIVLRVGIAISLILLSTSIAIKPKKNIFDFFSIGLLLLLAYFFHATAIIGLIIIFIIIMSKEYRRQFYFIVWLFIGFIYFTNLFERISESIFNVFASMTALEALSSKINSYKINSLLVNQGISMKFLFFWGVSLILAFSSRHKGNSVYFKYLNVLYVGVLLFVIFRSILLIERITDFFTFFSFVLLSFYLYTKKDITFLFYFFTLVILQLTFILRITG